MATTTEQVFKGAPGRDSNGRFPIIEATREQRDAMMDLAEEHGEVESWPCRSRGQYGFMWVRTEAGTFLLNEDGWIV